MKSTRGAHPLTPAVWAGTIALVGLGVFAAGGRALHLEDWVAQMQTVGDPVRARIFAAMDQSDPFVATRADVALAVDSSFAAHPATTLWHVVGGAIFLVLAPFQFIRRVRQRWPAVHRWSGRLLLVLGSIAAISGLFFGIFAPYGGDGERLIVALFGGLFLTFAGLGYASARRRDIDRHREWVTRAFALGIAISVIRVVAIPFDLLLTPRGFTQKELFVIVMGTGFIATSLAAELWLARTRRRSTVSA